MSVAIPDHTWIVTPDSHQCTMLLCNKHVDYCICSSVSAMVLGRLVVFTVDTEGSDCVVSVRGKVV